MNLPIVILHRDDCSNWLHYSSRAALRVLQKSRAHRLNQVSHAHQL